MEIRVDHVTIAGSDLDALRRAFADAGLATEYGGLHSNGITHMALLGFDDGSYIELISTATPARSAPWWPEHISGDAGPCAWCARVGNLGAECERLKQLGIPVRGPSSYHRDRPDGGRVEWDLADVGAGERGVVLPFLIEDRTPRTLRVEPSPSVSGTELTGVMRVVIGVRDAVWSAALFEQVYGWIRRETRPEPAFGATVVQFRGTPVTLAAPLGDGWLAERLDRFGECPAAFLLSSGNLDASAARLPATRPGTWLGRPVLWFDRERLCGVRLGIIQDDGKIYRQR